MENTKGRIGFNIMSIFLKGSKEKGLAMTTGFNIWRLSVNFTGSEFLLTYGWPRQRAGWCRRQALFLYSLPADLIFCYAYSVSSLQENAGEDNAL
jgi:hypothetical protein